MASYDYLFKILLIGDSGIGKSCLLLRFSDDGFDNLGHTVGVDWKIRTIELQGRQCKLQIWDTAGQERFNTITTPYYRASHAIIIGYDITDDQSFQNVQNWTKVVRQYAPAEVVTVLCGNKCDLVGKRQVSCQQGKDLAERLGIPFFETSAKTSESVEQMFLTTASLLMEKSIKNAPPPIPAQPKLQQAAAKLPRVSPPMVTVDDMHAYSGDDDNTIDFPAESISKSSNAICSGFLWKKRLDVVISSWRNRFHVLAPPHLHYYRDENSKLPIDTMDICMGSAKEVIGSLEVELKDGRGGKWRFRMESREDQIKWITAFEDCFAICAKLKQQGMQLDVRGGVDPDEQVEMKIKTDSSNRVTISFRRWYLSMVPWSVFNCLIQGNIVIIKDSKLHPSSLLLYDDGGELRVFVRPIEGKTKENIIDYFGMMLGRQRIVIRDIQKDDEMTNFQMSYLQYCKKMKIRPLDTMKTVFLDGKLEFSAMVLTKRDVVVIAGTIPYYPLCVLHVSLRSIDLRSELICLLFSSLRCCSEIISLDVSRNAYFGGDTEIVPNLVTLLEHAKKLEELNIRGIGLTDAGFELLCNCLLKHNLKLQKLNIGFNPIGIASILHLSKMVSQHPQLKVLECWNTKITDFTGVAAVMKKQFQLDHGIVAAVENGPQQQQDSQKHQPILFENSKFRSIYDATEVPKQSFKVLEEVHNLICSYGRLFGVNDNECQQFFKKIEKEALIHSQGAVMLENIELLATRLWTSDASIVAGGRKMPFYSMIQHALRSDDETLLKPACVLIRAINQMCVTRMQQASPQRVPWPSDHTLYRGGSLPDIHFESFFKNVGRCFRFRTFFATSMKFSKAIEFMQRSDQPRVLWVVKIDPVYTCVHVNYVKLSAVAEEEEFLFAPYSVFTVKSAEFNQQYQHYKIELDAAVDNKFPQYDNIPSAPWS